MRLSFDGFHIDMDSGQLFVAGQEVPLEQRALEMLCYLASHPDRLITKEELLSEVWHAQTLSDAVLSNTATKLRKALRQPTGTREPIETVRGRGFRWHAARQSNSPVAGVPSARAGSVCADPFVGRAQALEVLGRALEQASQGVGQTVVLLGDAGMGKTRTLEELAKRARASGFSVWEGAAYDGGGAPPYWLWVEVLRRAHTDLSNAMFRRHLPPDSWAMVRLVPELVSGDATAGAHATSAAADQYATRFRMFDEVVRFIGAASADAPRLIVAEDIHWADDGTLELLAHAARALKKQAVLLAVSSRELDTAAQGARGEALQRLSRQATHVPLSGLSPIEVGELIAAWVKQPACDASMAALLHERTRGNPFFVRQTLELIAHQGLAFEHQSLAGLVPPRAVRDVLRQRLATLSDDSMRVLRLAAAIGVEFDAGLLADALEMTLADVLALLEPARRKALVVPHPTALQRFGFEHVLLRDAIYDALDLAERGAYHARLGRVLERRSARDEPRLLGEIAHHSLRAVPGELDACVRHCQNAADAARRALGFETAAELLSRAIEKLASEGGDAHLRCELLLMLGTDRFCAGDIRSAWRAFQQAAVLSEQLAATDLLARAACRLAAWLEIGGGDEAETRRLVDRALQAIGDGDSDLRAALLAHRADMHFELPADERRALFEEADALAALRNTPHVLFEVAVCRTQLRDPTRVDECRMAIANYRAVVRKYRHELVASELLQAELAVDLAEYTCALTACDLDAADAAIAHCRALAEQTQIATITLTVELMQAGRALGDARLDDLAATLQRVSENSGIAGGFSLVWNHYLIRLIEARGELASLAAFDLEQHVPDLSELRPVQRMTGMLCLAWLAQKLGAHDTTRRFMARVPADELARMPVRYGDLGLMCLLAEIYDALDDRGAAQDLYARLLPHAERNAVCTSFDYCGAVAHYLGILARRLGQKERAAHHFARAEAINGELRMPLQRMCSSALAKELRE